jgi:2,4-dienoyl-CoA reductase-like NADH-dependent reductase (Old Yellow Enzyme family)
MTIFEKCKLGNIEIKNRIIRSATYEGMCDENGIPNENYIELYRELATKNIGAIITGFTSVSKDGRAMQPKQTILDSNSKIKHFKNMTKEVKKTDTKIFLQIAHTGRQTIKEITQNDILGVSDKKSFYFREKPKTLTKKEIYNIIENFSNTALYAKEAGFDGIQLHAAHGYLIHQFILESINNREDEFGICKEKRIGTLFLSLIIDKIREKCGKDYTILVKISGSDDYFKKFKLEQFKNLINFLDDKKVAGIEISCGTMDYPLNIFRGDINIKAILKHNAVFKKRDIKSLYKNLYTYLLIQSKTKPFSSMYNIYYAKSAKKLTNIPIVSVGGFRKADNINKALNSNWCDFVSLSRPFICEKDFAEKIKNNNNYISKCSNCNLCVIMCDTKNEIKCYGKL